MRVTVVLRANNLGNQFKFYWLTQARRKIREDGTRAALEAKGIHAVNPKEFLTPAYPKRVLEAPIPPKLEETFATPPPVIRDTPCHVFTHRFSPIGGLAQAQLITNSLTRTTLPQTIADHAATVDGDGDASDINERVKEAILHAHLLDTFQERLPRIHDAINNPGWVFPIEYGIPLCRKHKTLTYQLLLLLDQVESCGLERQLVEDTSTAVMLNHGDRLMQLMHDAAYLVSSPRPLPPMASPEEVRAASESEGMPDLYPMSPFINCRARTSYSEEERYGVTSSQLHPHTIFIHHNQPYMPHQEDTFTGMSLLYAFSHAAAYAKLVRKDPIGDLDEPITVQVVHINRQRYHFGVFQLNTLNLNPATSDAAPTTTRNLFWTQPWETLFDTCKFKVGKPVLEGYNPKVFSLLRGLHVQG